MKARRGQMGWRVGGEMVDVNDLATLFRRSDIHTYNTIARTQATRRYRQDSRCRNFHITSGRWPRNPRMEMGKPCLSSDGAQMADDTAAPSNPTTKRRRFTEAARKRAFAFVISSFHHPPLTASMAMTLTIGVVFMRPNPSRVAIATPAPQSKSRGQKPQTARYHIQIAASTTTDTRNACPVL
ncbi:hypothetical protein BD410DRAFT_808542 [Rickenella mellea]|uniref:Uncharacterized protein n=1 Tax=Rickenella mellea TaxID=50990 RepID=A0A4Y7PM56_9AGAM|nr:hypothetical protein BD410DRAFT_808542 [Rickenella mellea]